MNLFKEAKGGRIISTMTGTNVATVDVGNLTTDEAARVMAAVLTALETAFAHAPKGATDFGQLHLFPAG